MNIAFEGTKLIPREHLLPNEVDNKEFLHLLNPLSHSQKIESMLC